MNISLPKDLAEFVYSSMIGLQKATSNTDVIEKAK